MPAANALSLEVRRGGFHLELEATWDERVAVIFGPSGSGKTTLLEAVLGLVPAPGARIRLGGSDLEALPVEGRGLGWVPQDAALFPHLPVEANLRFGQARAGGDAAALDRALEVLEIGDLLARRVDQLSGGERQRVAIARALASGPRALLLDEPLASLDVALRARVLPYLLRVRDQLDLPILYITHDPDEAMLVGAEGQALVLDAGRRVAQGPPRQVLWSRAVLPLAEALGIENVLEGRLVTGPGGECALETRGGLRLVVPSLSAGDEAQATLRAGIPAHDLLLCAEPPGLISARNVFPARVERLEEHGGDALVHLSAGGGEGDERGERLVAKLVPAAVAALGLAPGARVHVVVKAQAIRRLA